ncbi:DUF3014 domain-containing protein [Methylosoma difficile]
MGRYDQSRSKQPVRQTTPRERKRSGVHILTVLVLMMLSAAGGFYFAKFSEHYELAPEARNWLSFLQNPAASQTEESEGETATTALPVGDGEQLEKITPPEEDVILPVLEKSDIWLRQALLGLSPGLAQWLDKDQLLMAYLTIANDTSQGLRTDKHVRFLKPDQAFAVAEDGQGPFIAGESYHRYDTWVAAINALDIQATLKLYKKVRPLLQQGFAEFGYPEGTKLEAIFNKAAAEILAAPVIERRVSVIKKNGYYRYADPNLEAANPLHKQMLRMGPENTRIIKNKLRQLADGLIVINLE